jgi:molybdenum cofactor cytidylyltransferase
MPASSIDAVILAAGRSRRMGAQKLLLPFAGQTVIGHIIDQVVAAPIRRTVVVTAAADNSVRAAMVHKSVTFAENPDSDSEMLGSIRIGLLALAGDAAASLIVLGDQPSLRRDVIEQLIAAFQAGHGGIFAPSFLGRRGHPLLITSRYFQEILTQHDSVGLRGLLEAHSDDLHDVAVADPGVVCDMDQPDDYTRELSNYLRRQEER